jgi:PAS domain S-box-containing protein
MASELYPVSPSPTELIALRDRAEKFQSIFENSALGIFQSTLSGRFLSVNPAFARLFGYDSPAEVIASVKDIGQQVYARPEQREDVLAAITAGEGLGRFEAEFVRRDGQVFFALLSIRAIRDASGRISHLDGFIEDVTEAKRREQAIKERVDHLARENVRLRASVQDRYRLGEIDRKSTRLNSSHRLTSRMPSSA